MANAAVTPQLIENDHVQRVEKGPVSLLCALESFSVENSLCGPASQGAMVSLKPPAHKCAVLFPCPSLALGVAFSGDFWLSYFSVSI